jgi:hypothetical protein
MILAKCPKCGNDSLNLSTRECTNCQKISVEDYGWKLNPEGKQYVLYNKDAEAIDSFSKKSDANINKIAKTTGIPVEIITPYFTNIELAAKTPPPQPKPQAVEMKFDDPDLRNQALEILQNAAFFYMMAEPFRKGIYIPELHKTRFVIGEDELVRLLGVFAIGAVYCKETPIIIVQGDGGTDKDGLVLAWLELLVDVKAEMRSMVTAASFRYSPNLSSIDLLYVSDVQKIEGDFARELRHGRGDDLGNKSEYALKDPENNTMTTECVSIPKYAKVFTTNEVPKDTPLLSGCWLVRSDNSVNLTKQVQESILRRAENNFQQCTGREIELWRYVFHIMCTEELLEKPIVVPWARLLQVVLSANKSERRRDPDKLLGLIRTVAWMRRFQKPTERRGEADAIDLVTALRIGSTVLAETMSGLDKTKRKILHTVRNEQNTNGRGMTTREIATSVGVDQKTASNRCGELISEGYLLCDKYGERRYFIHPSVLYFETGVGFPPKSQSELVKAVLEYSRSNQQPLPQKMVDPITGHIANVTSTSSTTQTEPSTPSTKSLTNESSQEKMSLKETSEGAVQNNEISASNFNSDRNQSPNNESEQGEQQTDCNETHRVFIFELVNDDKTQCTHCAKWFMEGHVKAAEISTETPYGHDYLCKECFEAMKGTYEKCEWQEKEKQG